MEGGAKTYRIKSRFRFTAFVVAVMIILVTGSNSILGMYNADGLTRTEYRTVEICAGDTLWNIASEYMPDTEVRKAVHSICVINDTSAEQIKPGQVIKVPVTVN